MQNTDATTPAPGPAQAAESPTPPAPPLTPRQHTILTLIAHGATDQQAAGLLKISPITVAHHLARARDQLGAHTTPHAVFLALKYRVIEL